MPTADSAPSLPISLQKMMADAQASLERWENEPDGEDDQELLAETHDWTLRLSRGEVDDQLYWECVAEDCEQAGDWEGALAAHRRVQEVATRYASSPHGDIAALLALLGRHEEALRTFRLASQQLSTEECQIFYRIALADEAYQLLAMGRLRAAERVVRRAIGTFGDETDDLLNVARLWTLMACCELERGRVVEAGAELGWAWESLEGLADRNGASGVLSVTSQWWRAEARRRRHAGEGAAEIEACTHAVANIRTAAAGWEFGRLYWDAAVARRLVELADALQRHGRADEAAASRREVEALRLQWRLPATSEPVRTGIWRRVFQRLSW